ncbi:hypothetical protein NCAS_0B05570 [Naumovozyma castellii]|uniref:VPS10 domain-containing protein n=1 Tax=Naumovozyma castellii TaxID=27288 RepID=G0V9M5_NAUCA|nr:hypothetical protein NCAS_0B05570 [Naumovozyma castellii CBS 4309]CCC68641.1 hypothetical protein NCAS_0B05570 [Naumovozyma castellii CBS 4309]
MKLFSWLPICGIVISLLNLTLAADEFVPKVTRTISKLSFNVAAFDDSTILLKLEDNVLYRTTNNGETWNPVKGIDGDVIWVDIDEFNSHDRAFVTSRKLGEFYVTDDQGDSWRKISIDVPDNGDPSPCGLFTHPTNKDFLNVRCNVCEKRAQNQPREADKNPKPSVPPPPPPGKEIGNLYNPNRPRCQLLTFVSKNNGKSFTQIKAPSFDASKKDHLETTQCSFIRSTKGSQLGDSESNLLCLYKVVEENSEKSTLERTITDLFVTSDWGKTVKSLDTFKDLAISSFNVLDSSILIQTNEDAYNSNSAKKLWVSRDGVTFKEAYLPTELRYSISGKITEDSVGRIILPINAKKTEDEKDTSVLAEILISDSSGLKFEPFEWSKADIRGYSQLSQPKHLKGTMLGSFFPRNRRARKGSKKQQEKSSSKGITKISVDNGQSWSNLRIVDSKNKDLFPCDIDDVEKCSLHIPMMLFGSDDYVSAGIMMAVGFAGDGSNSDWENEQTFLSRDGGLTWQLAFEFPTVFAMGDSGNVIVAVPFNPEEDDDPEAEFYYSLDQGKSWTEYQLQKPIIPVTLTSTTPDGSGLNFVLSGMDFSQPKASSDSNFIYAIDFSELFNGKICKTDDFETWSLAEGKCVAGVKYSYSRRKQDAKCISKKLFEDLQLKEEICDQCTKDDYECSFEFSKDQNGGCVPDYKLLSLSGACSKAKNDAIQLKPMQLISGTKCKKELQVDTVNVPCKGVPDSNKHKDKGKNRGEPIVVTENSFDGKMMFYQYFDSIDHESVILGDTDGKYYISHDGGQTMQPFDSDGESIVEVVFNPYFNTSAYLFGKDGTLFVTNDGGYTFTTTELPDTIQLGFPLDFHAKDEKTFIYYGGKNCDSILSADCHPVAYITKDGGQTFKELLDSTIHCEFCGSQYKHPYDQNMIICQVKETGSTKRTLVSSTDYFKNDKKVIFDNILGYMSDGEFSIVAVIHDEKELRTYVSADGDEFAEAKLPQDLENIKQKAFTVIPAHSPSVFLHYTTNSGRGVSFGRLLKSNSNGTSFVTLEPGVNRNDAGLVDFEKIQGLEGIMVINVVDNLEQVRSKNEAKKLKTKVTFNDGADWDFLKPPTKDSNGKKYSCSSKNLNKCSLNLHGYTERSDFRDTYSSGSALGYMVGIGNVGEYLQSYDEASTFLTTDGGLTWSEIKKGAYQYEYGDHGGIIVLVADKTATDTLSYSLDAGKTWTDYKFADEKIIVDDLITVPKDSAMRFLLIGQSSSIRGANTKTFTIDFSGSFKRQCILDVDNEDSDDFDYFSLNPSKSECLFGHQKQYLHKIHDDCFVGNVPLTDFTRITKNCSCTRNDFECDYNFYKANDGTCKLVEGLTPIPASDICKKNPDLIEFSEPTGYRMIPLSTCQGGLKLHVAADTYPCPGKEQEFNTLHGIAGRSFILIFLIPFIIFVLVAWFVYVRGIRRNGGFARFGEIRLGEDDLIENNGTDKAVNYIVKTGLYLFSGIYAGYQLAKRSTNGLLSKWQNRSNRRGPSYSSLLDDQFLDDADDLLTGHDEDANDLSSFADQDSNFDIDEDSIPPEIVPQPYSDEHPADTPAVETDDVPAAEQETEASTNTDTT